MRPTEERPIQGYWAGDDRPDPLVAQSAPEFVGQLRALVQWSGLSLEEIEQLARANGDILPPSIVSAALSHNTLPPEELVVALVAAVGDDDEMVELWASVLWRLEEEGDATQYIAPHSAPAPPPVPVSDVAASRQYSGGALAQAVQKRRNQNGWTGLHRGFQKGLRATGFGAKLGQWKVPLAVSATIFVLVVGVSWALASRSGNGNGNNAQPRSNPCCAAGSGSPASKQPVIEGTPSGMPLELPVPTSSTKPTQSPTPKASPPRNSPTPTQTQEQLAPKLTGSATANCTNSGSDWVVEISVTATLTNGSGSNPQGQAGKAGDPQNLPMTGSGTMFTGSVTITIGPNTDPAPSGSLDWRVTVTVSGAAVSDNGSKGYNCT